MLSQETDIMCASFVSGCAVSYASLCLFNHFRLSDDERRKIGMLNCLLDRVKLELEIREFDAKLLRNKELENDTQDELCAVRIEIGKLEDVKDKVIENLEDNMDVDDMQNQEPVEDMMDIDDQEHMLPEEPMDDPMEEIGLDLDEENEKEQEEQEDEEDSDSDIGEDEEEEKPAVWPLDRRVRDYKLNELRDKEEELLEQLVTYQNLVEEQTTELEEMRERYDTLSEISTMEACGINFKTVLECKLEEKNALIQELRHQIKCKDDLIQRLEGRLGAD